ncbi:hypothetical protein [Paracoccus yeei]|uniref:hypothetical protein n=1 Tax=Paracoccus yeei TaxID=147645 RepID=UPI00174DE32D|nr:hypothetical protein [Paracoccus yeei]
MFTFASFLVQLVVGISLQVIGYLLKGQPKTDKSEAVKDLENPTAEAGRPIPVPFGEVEIKGLNVLWYGQKYTRTYEVKA